MFKKNWFKINYINFNHNTNMEITEAKNEIEKLRAELAQVEEEYPC